MPFSAFLILCAFKRKVLCRTLGVVRIACLVFLGGASHFSCYSPFITGVTMAADPSTMTDPKRIKILMQNAIARGE